VLAPIAAAAILAAGYYTLEGGKLVTKCGSLAEMLGTCGRMYVFGALAAFGILCFIGMRGRRTIAP
jgi:hypothetical protein